MTGGESQNTGLGNTGLDISVTGSVFSITADIKVKKQEGTMLSDSFSLLVNNCEGSPP